MQLTHRQTKYREVATNCCNHMSFKKAFQEVIYRQYGLNPLSYDKMECSNSKAFIEDKSHTDLSRNSSIRCSNINFYNDKEDF